MMDHISWPFKKQYLSELNLHNNNHHGPNAFYVDVSVRGKGKQSPLNVHSYGSTIL